MTSRLYAEKNTKTKGLGDATREVMEVWHSALEAHFHFCMAEGADPKLTTANATIDSNVEKWLWQWHTYNCGSAYILLKYWAYAT